MNRSQALYTDFYQLTMAVGYLSRGMAHTPVTCEAFVRRLPRHRSYLLVCGLEQVLDFVENLRFTHEQIAYLKKHPVLGPALSDEVCAALADFRFSGDIWAMPEGTVAFAAEPLIRVSAELWQAQLVETGLLSILNHATMVASKAARIVAAAGDGGVLEFGTRRTHDEAAVDAARAAYVAGALGTSNVEAGFRYGVPIFGTAAHMWTMAHESEAEAFDSYLDVYPNNATLLVDTYDILDGTRRACAAARKKGGQQALGGVRIDCDLYDEHDQPTGICGKVRALLDEEGFSATRIIVSGDMNETRIATLKAAGEPIDAYGVGTELVTSKDAPSLGGVYKLVQVGEGGDARGVIKLSAGKVTYPGKHQVFREVSDEGIIKADHLALDHESRSGKPLLRPFVWQGDRVDGAREHLDTIRDRAQHEIASLPEGTVVADDDAIKAKPTDALTNLLAETRARFD